MLNNRLTAAKDVKAKLIALESAIDSALISAAELAAAVPAARQRAKLSAVVAQDAIALTGESLAALYQARAKIVEAHHAFADVQDQIGVTPYMSGDLWKIPAAAAEAVPLALVSDRAA